MARLRQVPRDQVQSPACRRRAWEAPRLLPSPRERLPRSRDRAEGEAPRRPTVSGTRDPFTCRLMSRFALPLLATAARSSSPSARSSSRVRITRRPSRLSTMRAQAAGDVERQLFLLDALRAAHAHIVSAMARIDHDRLPRARRGDDSARIGNWSRRRRSRGRGSAAGARSSGLGRRCWSDLDQHARDVVGRRHRRARPVPLVSTTTVFG